MSDLNRRQFLAALGATIVLTAAPLRSYPVLYADGVNSDSDALEEAFRGGKIQTPNGDIWQPKIDGTVYLNNLTLSLDRTLYINDCSAVISGCHINTGGTFPDGLISFSSRRSSHIRLQNNKD